MKEKEGKTEERLDFVDINGVPNGRIHLRGTPILPGDYIRSVTVCVFNEEGQMLIQQRQSDKASWPDLWDVSAAGAIEAGESPQMAAMREAEEELGIKPDFAETRPNIITTFSNGFTFTFIAKLDIEVKDIRIQKEELQQVRFAKEQEIIEMIERGEFVPYRISWIRYLFDISDGEYMF